ncbi:hypothetical protein F4778DRAFT_344222 [Xylariomycetidae sp. FL2044]|nr:hypothetical protein F4778DRAFT_344222 [Xylariomycetidae sp. FL2044]
MSSSNTLSLGFGIEMEMLVKPNDNLKNPLKRYGWNPSITPSSVNVDKHGNRKALRKALAETLTINGLPAGLIPGDYDQWTVADEPSLDEKGEFWRIELVSRVMDSSDPWNSEIDTLFDVVRDCCEILLTKGCATHVHVSPSKTRESRYTVQQLHQLLKSIAAYDDAITKLMPPDRKNNEWAESNLHSPKTLPAFKTAYQSVPTSTWKPLFNLFDKIQEKEYIHKELFKSRSVSWNFANVVDMCGTVEFRRPPGVELSEDANHWIAFTLGFVAHGLTFEWSSVLGSKVYPDVSNLAAFVQRGTTKLRSGTDLCLAPRLLAENNEPPTVFTDKELGVIRQKKASKEGKESMFVHKANSRSSSRASSMSRSGSPGSHSSSSGKSGKKVSPF